MHNIFIDIFYELSALASLDLKLKRLNWPKQLHYKTT